MSPQRHSAIVHSLTPFDESYQLDESALRMHLRRLRDAGVSVYLGASGAAEGHTLSREERDRILAIGVEELKGRVPVFAAGCEQHTAKEMVEFVRSAEHLNVDAAQVYSLDMGHGVKPTPAEVEIYFRTIFEATSLPLIISNQAKVGYSLPLKMVEQFLVRYPHIVGFAYDAKNTTYMTELVLQFGKRMAIYSSGSDNAVFALGIGANGFQGMDGNVVPHLCASIISAFEKKDMVEMHLRFRQLMHLRTVLRGPTRTNMRAIKPLLNAFGLHGGNIRPPRVPIGGAELNEVIALVQGIGIPEIANWTRKN